MYIPKPFEIKDKKEISAFIQSNAFAQLISNARGRLYGTHLPLLMSEDKARLIGHIARQNPQAQDIEGQEVLVIFQGAHDYISPSWYSQEGVPTWNYQAVHVYGHCKVLNGQEELKQIVETLTHKYESGMSQRWQPDFNPSMLHAIVGIEISINEIQCKYKLSQNRSEQDQRQVIEQLRSLGSFELAEAMSRNKDIKPDDN